VALQCLLSMGGEAVLEKTLKEVESLGLTKTEEDVDNVMVRIIGLPDLMPGVQKLLKSDSAFATGIAVGVLGEAGSGEDFEALKKLKDDDRDLPKGFRHKTVGDAAKAAIAQLEQKGHK